MESRAPLDLAAFQRWLDVLPRPKVRSGAGRGHKRHFARAPHEPKSAWHPGRNLAFHERAMGR